MYIFWFWATEDISVVVAVVDDVSIVIVIVVALTAVELLR